MSKIEVEIASIIYGGMCRRRAGLISRIGELSYNTIVILAGIAILAGEWTATTRGRPMNSIKM